LVPGRHADRPSSAVPDDLLARALHWLFGGLRAEHHAEVTDQEGDDTR